MDCAALADDTDTEDIMVKFVRTVEAVIFYSRWLLAPLYLGLVAALFILALNFFKVFVLFVGNLMSANQNDVILGVLSLIDVVFTANLVLIVIFSGYENFVSRIDTSSHPNWPIWITKIDFAGLKQKMLASIVAISAIHVLEAFLNIDSNFDAVRMTWLVAVHLVFVISALLLALSDRWTDKHE
jgi:uncharacterized protein (TIGR00645 family)